MLIQRLDAVEHAVPTFVLLKSFLAVTTSCLPEDFPREQATVSLVLNQRGSVFLRGNAMPNHCMLDGAGHREIRLASAEVSLVQTQQLV